MFAPPARHRIDALRRRPAIRSVRAALTTATALAALTVLGQPAIAAADTARIVLPDAVPFSGPVQAAIAVTTADGRTHALGPYSFRAEPSALRRSPDGRYFAVLVGDWSTDARGLTIVPTDGSPPFEVPPRTQRGGPYDTEPENFSWTFDSGEVVLGNTDADDGPPAKVVLRCSVARRRCSAIPGVDGFAATVPGGIVTSTAFHTLTVETSIFLPGDSSAPVEPGTLPVLRKRWRSRTAFVGPKTWTLASRRASLLDGLHGATAIVGGPAGALLTQDRYRLRLGTRRGQSVVQVASNTRRWILVRPDRRTRTVVAPRLAVPKAHSAPTGDLRRLRSQRAFPRARAPIGSGGWLAVTGVPVLNGGTEGLVLTTITPGGRAAFFRTGGQISSAAHLVRSVAGRTAIPGATSLDVVGHEASTNAAIVGLHWFEGSAKAAYFGSDSGDDQPTAHTATVRVPLDGRTAPTLINLEREQAAW